MFPPKIKDFVVNLREKTEKGEFSWVYDDDNASVDLQTNLFTVSLRYSFNQIEEVGEFVLFYFDAREQKEYRFYTNQTWNDYDYARKLYDSAQSSGLNLPF
ncbi:hypothetical protein AN394_04180 [Pseudoalteromonas sp. P1-26]|uniref:hypothetical protein n=1 Tax=Pseudoalteromonas sp. P1-26 TaxID=1723759 RepID=UPI0006D67E1F|nr:hypothetical protein [Pseudoalteromonas sp. P1-26]KPZ66254.1 hypothetical protein AN394_04180 [Pseudoalteromonas sp. P1-26]